MERPCQKNCHSMKKLRESFRREFFIPSVRHVCRRFWFRFLFPANYVLSLRPLFSSHSIVNTFARCTIVRWRFETGIFNNKEYCIQSIKWKTECFVRHCNRKNKLQEFLEEDFHRDTLAGEINFRSIFYFLPITSFLFSVFLQELYSIASSEFLISSVIDSKRNGDLEYTSIFPVVHQDVLFRSRSPFLVTWRPMIRSCKDSGVFRASADGVRLINGY